MTRKRTAQRQFSFFYEGVSMSKACQKTFRGYLIDHHSPPPPVVSLDRIDVLEYERFYREAHINTLMVYCKDHWGYTYYDTQTGKRHPGLKEDWIAKIVPILKRNNIEFNAYYCIEYDNYAPTVHPGWSILKADGTPLRCSYSKAGWYMPCYETGYRGYVLQQLSEIVSGYRPDSLFLDIFGKSLCYCPICRKKFKSRYGYELPEKEKELNEAFADVSDFLTSSAEDLLREIIKLVKKINPDIKVTINFAALYPKEIRDMLDYQFTEPWAGNWLSAAYARDTAYMQSPQLGPGTVSEVYNYSPVSKYILAASEIAAQGCRVFMYSGSQHPDGTLEHEEAKRVGAAYREIAAYEHLLGEREVIADIAIIQSDLNEKIRHLSSVIPNAIGRVKAGSPHRNAVLGAMRLCDYTKYGWKILPEQDVNIKTLRNIKIVILPDMYHLNESLYEELKTFIQEGGILLTSGETGMYGRDGRKLSRWMLREVAGADFKKRDTVYEHNDWSGYLNFTSTSLAAGLPLTTPPVDEVRYLLEAESAESAAIFMDPATPVSDRMWVNWWSPPPSKRTDDPAIIKNNYGKGQVYYCAFDLFNLANKDFPWVNSLFHKIIDCSIDQPAFHLETETPNLIGITGYRRTGNIQIHIVSFLAEKAEGDVAPIYAGRLSIAENDFTIHGIRTIYPEHKDLPLHRKNGIVFIDIPKVIIHTILEVILTDNKKRSFYGL